MTIENAEILFWLALSCWALGFLLCLYALVFRRQGPLFGSVICAALGLIPHSGGIAVRWIATGRPPFISLYELISTSAWFAVLSYLVAQSLWRSARPSAVAVLPVALLSMGAALTLSAEPNALTPALKSWWLVIHILFAMIAHGAFAIAFGAALLFLFRRTNGEGSPETLVPSPDKLDLLGARCIVFGFICHTVMVLSGSIWADKAWGRFWGWDPIEIWSLLTWLIYGLYSHLRLLPHWRGKRAAVYSAGAFVLVVFSFWGVPHLWKSIHDYTLYSGN